MRLINIRFTKAKFSMVIYIMLAGILLIINLIALFDNMISINYLNLDNENFSKSDKKFIEDFINNSEHWMTNQIELLLLNIIINFLIVILTLIIIKQYKKVVK